MHEKNVEYLEYLKRTYERIMDELDVGLHVVNKDGKTILYNKKMMEMEFMKSEDVLDKDLLEVFMFKKGQQSTLLRALEAGEETKNEKQTYFNNKGKEVTTVNNTFPIIEKMEIQGAVEIARDITKIERLVRENIKRKKESKFTFENIIGKSSAIQEVIESAKRATRTSSYVLIVGETGTGKELFAQGIHYESNRASRPFISQNCAALPDNLIESLLFGTKRGAFTGAADHAGLFQQAEGGTLLLDEINSLNIHLQAKLLRVLQEKKVKRIGDTKETSVDVRIIAHINEDPIDAIANKHLRKDLYYRLGVVTLFIPPLRERKEDISLLAQHFILKYNKLFQMDVQNISEDVLQLFLSYEWPGNVRELEHVIEAAMNIMGDEEERIERYHLPMQYRTKWEAREEVEEKDPLFKMKAFQTLSLKDQMKSFERYCIVHALRENNFKISKTAHMLGLSRQSLQYRMKRLNIEKE